jgi:hypothetical protein
MAEDSGRGERTRTIRYDVGSLFQLIQEQDPQKGDQLMASKTAPDEMFVARRLLSLHLSLSLPVASDMLLRFSFTVFFLS